MPLLIVALLLLGQNGQPVVAALAQTQDTAEVTTPTNKTSDTTMTLADVMDKALTAYGGKLALLKLAKNATAYGRELVAAEASRPYSYRACWKDKQWRLDLDNSVKTDTASPNLFASDDSVRQMILAFDGELGWQSDGKAISALSGEALERLKNQVGRQPFLIAHWQEADYKFTLNGLTTYKGVPVYAVSILAPEQNNPTTVFIDQRNFLVIGLLYETERAQGKAASKHQLVSIDFSEYRPVNGTVFAFKQERFLDGVSLAQVQWNNVDLSTEIADDFFQKPNSGTAVRLSRKFTLPFEYTQRQIILKGRINGSDEYDFLFDTGASETIIDRRVAAEQYLAKEGQFDIAAMSGVVSAQTSSLRRLELGKLIVNDVPVRILDLTAQSKHLGRPLAGIIGTSLIGKFLTTIDYGKPSITFADLESSERPSAAHAVPFAYEQAPFINALLNGKENATLLMDTGAAFNHLPNQIANQIQTDPSAVKHVTEGTGLDGLPVQLGTVIVDSVNVGGLAVKKVSFTYPIKASSSQNAQSKPGTRGGFFQGTTAGILGNPFWQNFIVTLDWKFQKLLLEDNPAFKTRDEIVQAVNAGDAKLVLYRDYRAAEIAYQKGLIAADRAGDLAEQARLLGRLGNLRRIMAKDLSRPEHAAAAADYFVKGDEKARKAKAKEIEGRILADWSLLYSDNGNKAQAKQAIDQALLLSPDDANVNVDCAVHLYRAKLFPEMQKYIEKALFLDPDNWQALWYQVKLSEYFYDTPHMVSTLKEILHYYPWSKVAADKLKSLNNSTSGASQSEGQTKMIVRPAQ